MALMPFEAVTVWEGNRKYTLMDVGGAICWLVDHWPDDIPKPESYNAAVVACLKAMSGKGDVSDSQRRCRGDHLGRARSSTATR